MNTLRHYLQLKTELSPHVVGDWDDVTLERLAAVLGCSERNVKLLLRKQSALQWIEWQPGRGRGHHSKLRLLQSIDGLAVDEAQRLADAGNLQAAFELVGLSGVSASAREKFVAKLSGHFGYREEEEDGGKIEALRLSIGVPIASLDPIEALFSKDQHLIRQISDTLVRYEPQEGLAGTLKPHVAHAWDSDDAGRRWTFYLRKKVMFHHGKELTASDAAFTLLRLRGSGASSPYGWLAACILHAHALDRYTLRVELRGPNYMFAHFVTASAASIVPEDIYGTVPYPAELSRMPVGSGPFRVMRHDDNCCLLEANDRYFQGRAHLDKIEIWWLPENLGSCGVMLELELEAAAAADTQSVDRMEMGCTMLTFNLNREGPQQRLQLRKAIHHAVNRGGFAALEGNGHMFVASSFLPPEAPTRSDEAHDPVKAAVLVAESGYGGEALRMIASVRREREARWIRERCASIGIFIEIGFHDHLQCLDSERIADADMCLFGVVAEDNTALSLLEMVKTPGLSIRSHSSAALVREIDACSERLFREPDESKWLPGIIGLGERLAGQYQALFLFHETTRTNYNAALHGVVPNSTGLMHFKDLWFKSAKIEAGKQPTAHS